MSYTVTKLAKLSGVSVRTLHFYDEISLLKPASVGANNYRYYEEEQVLLLQQILFYRELGLPLNEIKEILTRGDFNKLKALESHRQSLLVSLEQSKKLLKTIDKTIQHLRGNTKMRDEEMFYGFDSEKQKGYEQELVDKGYVSKDEMESYRKKTKNYTQKDFDDFMKEGSVINEALVVAMKQGLTPESETVQALIRRHHRWVGWNPTKEKYIGLSELYQTPEFKNFYDKVDPELLPFLVAAMKIFAERKL